MHYPKEILLIYIQDLMTNNLINGGGVGCGHGDEIMVLLVTADS